MPERRRCNSFNSRRRIECVESFSNEVCDWFAPYLHCLWCALFKVMSQGATLMDANQRSKHGLIFTLDPYCSHQTCFFWSAILRAANHMGEHNSSHSSRFALDRNSQQAKAWRGQQWLDRADVGVGNAVAPVASNSEGTGASALLSQQAPNIPHK